MGKDKLSFHELIIGYSMPVNISKCRKRLGRMYRGKKIGIIISIKGEKFASESKGEIKESKK